MRKSLQTSVLFLVAGFAQTAAAASANYVIANNTPRFVASATKGAPVEKSATIDVTLWLTPHHQQELGKTIKALYNRNDPQFHQWLTPAAMSAMVAPSAEEARSVARFLKASNLTIVSQDKFNFFVRAHGTVADIETAFHVKLANMTVGTQTFRTNLADPEIADPAGAHVMAIEGLDNVTFVHHNIAHNAAIKGAPSARVTGMAETALSSTPLPCFTGNGTETFSASGGTPSATYTGNQYTGSTLGCYYTPTQIQAAYGLTSLYAAGYDGTGQTIVIVDWCGSPTIQADANAYSKKFGLPPLTSANFAIDNFPAPSSCSAPDPEINIDVEWAHAIAPGANILLLVPPTADFDDVDSALLAIVEDGLGNNVSNSYGSEELYTSSAVVSLQNFIIEAGAAEGINMNFSTGDSGDYTFDFPKFSPASVISPADSPYATGIGGISLFLNSDSSIKSQIPWGNNVTLLAEGGPLIPALRFGFNGGGGGGTSAVFAKPSYQSALPGKFRKLPDVSWLADPFTGGIIAISEPFQSPSIIYTVYGGTSLACPMFAGLWAIANQVAGNSLGQAAPLLYGAPAGVVTDVLPVGSPHNVTASYLRANGKTTTATAEDLVKPLAGNSVFQSAVWNYPDNPGLAYLLSFGTDTGLKATPGWDNATGLGVTSPADLVTYVMTMAASTKH